MRWLSSGVQPTPASFVPCKRWQSDCVVPSLRVFPRPVLITHPLTLSVVLVRNTVTGGERGDADRDRQRDPVCAWGKSHCRQNSAAVCGLHITTKYDEDTADAAYARHCGSLKCVYVSRPPAAGQGQGAGGDDGVVAVLRWPQTGLGFIAVRSPAAWLFEALILDSLVR